MPNPYDDIFADGKEKNQAPTPPAPSDELLPPAFAEDGPDDLNLLLAQVAEFNRRAEDFSRQLSQLRVVDHEVKGKLARLFVVTADEHKRGTLAGEKQYHTLQTSKFVAIIEPMRALAELHLETVRRFNLDIDEHYFHPEKNEAQVASEKTLVMDGINLQRKILADAAEDLKILTGGLADTERRLKGYVNAGGENNLSASELELLIRKREALTSGRQHQFDYRVFDVNLLDKTAISLGIYLKETSTQYLKQLGQALSRQG